MTTLQREYFKTWMFKQGLSITLYEYLEDILCSALEEGRHGQQGLLNSVVVRTLTNEEFNSKELKILLNTLTNYEITCQNNTVTFYFKNSELF